MAQLEAFALRGYTLEMYPEDHDPPHFHIIKDDWNIRVKFNLSRFKKEIYWESKYPEDLIKWPLGSRETATLLKLIIENKVALNDQWQELHPSRKGLKKKKAEERKAEAGKDKKKAKEGKDNGSSTSKKK